MALLNGKSFAEGAQHRESSRLNNVSSRLTDDEIKQLDSLAEKRGVQRGELIRQLILRELAGDAGVTAVSPEMTEIVGVRLLLGNLLKATGTIPPQEYERIVTAVRREKRAIAAEVKQELEA